MWILALILGLVLLFSAILWTDKDIDDDIRKANEYLNNLEK